MKYKKPNYIWQAGQVWRALNAIATGQAGQVASTG